jgi:hypothetical protein
VAADPIYDQQEEDEALGAMRRAAQRTALLNALLNHRLLDQIGATSKLLAPLHTQIGSVLAEHQRRMHEASEPMRTVMAQINEQLASVRSAFQTHGTLLANWKERWPPLFTGEAGWYLDPHMPFPSITKFRNELASRPMEEIQSGLAAYFRRHIDRIEVELTARHSARSRLIRSAFAAHRAGNYDASIPLLFAQVDGICDDITNSHLFRKGLAGYASKTDMKDFERAYFEPLLQQIPVKFGEGRRGEGFTHLNRHAVMHGESLDYGTEENGLKAISLLNYVSYVLSDDET